MSANVSASTGKDVRSCDQLDVRSCSRCELRKGCRGPVPGEGPCPSTVMLIGEAPGEEEDRVGRPFVGKSGKLLDSMLVKAGLSRESVFITNVVKCKPAKGSPVSKFVGYCQDWLTEDLLRADPKVVMLMGATAIHAVLGNGTVDHLHGRPRLIGERIYLPAYHPAATLYDTSLLRLLFDDFSALGKLVAGADPAELMAVDEYANPTYSLVRNGKPAGAIDIETVGGKAWSIQWSDQPGLAFMSHEVPKRVDKAIVHNYLFDANYIEIKNPVDTMVMAYLLGLPQGLKELASRLCGMEMKSYDDVVLPGRREKARAYLEAVSRRNWPDPEPVEEIGWDNKQGRIVTKFRKPFNIKRKVNKILADCVSDPSIDPYKRWMEIDERERSLVEASMGVLEDSNLADVREADAVYYGCRDADATIRVYQKMAKMVEDSNLSYVLNQIDLPVLPIVKEMMDNGIALDVEYFKSLSAEYGKRMEEAASSAAEKAGERFNPNSSAQVAKIVYDKLGFKATAWTASHLVSTDDRELKKIKHPIITDILEYRRLAKNKDSFIDALLSKAVWDTITSTYRIHTTIKATRTETGRLSSSGPNLQAIPVRSTKQIRGGLVATPGFVMVASDYDQQEMKVMAHSASCKALIDMFNRNEDVHTATAARIFGIPYSEAKEEKYRYPTKRLNFGVIYGITPEGLAADIEEHTYDTNTDKWSVDDCSRLIKEWYTLYPEVSDYRMEMAAFARRNGYVCDMFGRRRFVPEVMCPIKSVQEAGVRQAGNMPVQSGSAGITKLAMIKLWKSRPPGVRFLLQVHDEIIVEAPSSSLDVCVAWMKAMMSDVVKLSVPLTVSVKYGPNWGELVSW